MKKLRVDREEVAQQKTRVHSVARGSFEGAVTTAAAAAGVQQQSSSCCPTALLLLFLVLGVVSAVVM
ncbi:hypothetical protein L6452_10003 [Arctium lappa]|uniref:Uncharacterized protein n=1 Tax=Arctium lappa TaxID=4217 RepID=A0ACB9DM06_ARCLA|nr:hypothetical protein L6452_10003 [Arctium lappa]